MRKGQKSKGLAHGGKHQFARGESQSLQGAQASAAEQGASTSAAKGAGEKSSSTSKAGASTQLTWGDSLTKKTSVLLHFLLDKCEKREPILHVDLQKLVRKKYQPQFPDILKRASLQLDLVYGLELKPGDPKNLSYSLVSKVGPATGRNLCGILEFPKKGLLMSLLGLIFMKGHHATEEEVWEFLEVLGIQAGKRHFIFGDAQKLITTDLVHERYLEYRQVPGSAPPCFEFLWGARAQAETTKMKVLEVLAKITGTKPSAFPSLHEEALRERAERGGRRAEAGAGRVPRARVHVRCKATDYSHI